jgi:hypothetical protein
VDGRSWNTFNSPVTTVFTPSPCKHLGLAVLPASQKKGIGSAFPYGKLDKGNHFVGNRVNYSSTKEDTHGIT